MCVSQRRVRPRLARRQLQRAAVQKQSLCVPALFAERVTQGHQGGLPGF